MPGSSKDIDLYGGYGPGLLAMSYTFVAIATILLGLRIYVAAFISSAQGHWPFFWAVIAYAMAMIESAFSNRAVHFGLGNHLAIIREAGKLRDFLYWAWMNVFWFLMNIGLGKIMACSFLLALHDDVHPKRRWLLHFVWFSNALAGIPAIFMMWFRCSPPADMFDPREQAKCNSATLIKYAEALLSWSAASDLVISLLPTFLVWPLQMRLRLKLVICFLMGLAVFAAVCSVMTAVYAKRLMWPDTSYDVGVLFMWAKATYWLVFISASVPPVWPLLKHLHDRSGAASKASRARGPSGSDTTSGATIHHSFIRLEDGPGSSRALPKPHLRITRHVEIEQHIEHQADAPASPAPVYGQSRDGMGIANLEGPYRSLPQR